MASGPCTGCPSWHLCFGFGFGLVQFIFYGGYPGAGPLVHDEIRWAAYVSDALIETPISKDMLLMARVQKSALLRRGV